MAVKISALPVAPLFELSFEVPTSNGTATTYKAAGAQIMTAFLRAQGYSVQPAAYCSTTTDLGATYDNGVAGVGATLTAGGNGVFTSDDVTPPLTADIIVPFQDNKNENGVYKLIDAGSVSTPWILERQSYWNEPSEIVQGQVIPVYYGTLYGNQAFSYIGASSPTIGTDNLIFDLMTPVTPENIQNMKFSYTTTTGDDEEYNAEFTPAVSSLEDGQMFLINFHTPNSSFATLTIQPLGLGPLTLVDVNGNVLESNSISSANYLSLVVISGGGTTATVLEASPVMAGFNAALTGQFVTPASTTNAILWETFSASGGIGSYNGATGEFTFQKAGRLSSKSAFAPTSTGADAAAYELVLNGTIIRNGVVALDTASNCLDADIDIAVDDVLKINVQNPNAGDSVTLNPGQVSTYWDVTFYPGGSTGSAPPPTTGNVFTFTATVTAAALASEAPVTIVIPSSGTAQYIILSAYGLITTDFSGGGGDRNILLTDGVSDFGTVPLVSIGAAAPYGLCYTADTSGIKVPSTSIVTTATAAGQTLYAVYNGGTTDYTDGSVDISFNLVQITA